MTRSASFATLFCLYTFLPVLADDGRAVVPPLPSASDIAQAKSFGPDDHLVATHYFYWYRWPTEHFFGNTEQSCDILRHHFPNHREVSYESVAWHRRQMEDLRAAGIDVALLVYWGAPNQYEKPDIRFSVHGIPPLVQALDDMANSGDAPRVGLFYDTSTLLRHHAFREPRDANVDLRTAEGKDIFYRTIRDFYCLVPPRHWACLDGRPIVQLYNSAFAAGHDQSSVDYVYERFARDFNGLRPFIVSGPSWSFGGDARTGWGAALSQPILAGDFAQIGPGYDDSPVPGRNSPTRDRLGGGYYAASWLLAIEQRPRMITIETWDELHEGTGVCETTEDGRFYIDLTRRYSDIYKSGQMPTTDSWAETVRTLLAGAGASREGRAYASRLELSASAGRDGEVVEDGLTLVRGVADGAFEVAMIADVPCIRTHPGVGDSRYLYFRIPDPYYYDNRGTLTVRFTYLDAGVGEINLQYDSTDDTGSIMDRYKCHPAPIVRTDTGTWRTAIIALPGARCANRQNGGADLRLAVVGNELAIRDFRVTKLRPGYAD